MRLPELITIAAILCFGASPAFAQGDDPRPDARTGTSRAKQPPQTEQQRKEAEELEKAKAEFRKYSQEYKASLQQLLEFRKRDVRSASEQLEREKKMFDEGLVTRREMEDGEQAVVTARAKVAEVEEQIKNADKRIEDVLAEADREVERAPRKRERTPTGRVYYVRFVIVGEIAVYDYSGAVRGRVTKFRNRVIQDSRR